MRSAAPFFALLLNVAWPEPLAAETTRAVPNRPAPPSRIVSATTPHHALGPVNVDLVDAAERFGLKASSPDAGRKLVLTSRTSRVELEVNSREMAVNGLRVFLGGPVIASHGRLYVSRIDFDGCLVPLLQPGRIGPPPARPTVIAIDPGHGGGDNGMQNEPLGLKEKVLTLDVAERLKKLLEAAGYKVVLTRTDDRAFSPDKKIDLPKRAQIANRAGADLFVSIHFNSLFPDTKTSGSEVFVYTRRGQRSDSSMGFGAENDTRNDGCAVNRFDAWSSVLADRMHRALIGGLKTNDRGQKTAHWLVLQDLDCPAVLVESLFLSNTAEARRAATPACRQQIAAALAAGIGDYAALVGSLRPKP